MSWQDLVLAVGGFVIAAGIIPTITGPVKPALTTSATIFVVLGVSPVAFALARFSAMMRMRVDWASRPEPAMREAEVRGSIIGRSASACGGRT